MIGKPRRKPSLDLLPDIALLPPALAPADPQAIQKLREALLQQKLPQLRALAAARRLAGRSGQRETLAAALIENLVDPAAEAAAVGALEQPARAVLALAVILGGPRITLLPADVARVVGGAGGSTNVEQALQQLAAVGLLLPTVESTAYRGQPAYQLPPTLAAHLLPLLPQIPAFSGDLPPEPEGEEGRGLDQAPALRKIAALLAGLQDAEFHLAAPAPREYRGEATTMLGRWEVVGVAPPPRPRASLDERPLGIQVATAPPLLAARDRNRLRAAGGLGSDEELIFFLHLLEALHLVGRAGPDLVVQPANVTAFTAAPALARLQQVRAAWLGLNTWSEVETLVDADPALALFRNPSLHYAEPSQMHAEVGHMREALILLLAWLPVGSWYDLAALLSSLHRFFPELPTNTGLKSSNWEQLIWWLERADGAGGRHYLNRRSQPDWLRGLGRIVATMVGGPLTWLGFAEVTALGGMRLDGVPPGSTAGFRLTELGGAVLSRRPAPLRAIQPLPAGVAADLSLGPALNIRAEEGALPLLSYDPRAVTLEDQITLAGLAEPLLVDAARCLYRLTPGAARRGFDNGIDPGTMERTLRRLSGGDLPDALARRLQAWWEAYGRLRFYTGVTLISFADDYTLTELLASTTLGTYLLYTFSPRLVVVPSASVDRLLAEWARAGYTPRVIDESRAAPAATEAA